MAILDGASVLLTGGTGSFGRKFVEIVLAECKPERLIVFSRDELKQHEMRQQFPDTPGSVVRYFVGDVRDSRRLLRAFQHIDYVVHAAALKQVPACEYNPIEAVGTNIGGACNVIDAALDCGVKRVLALSTDKACAPVNLYGKTKAVAESLFVQANSYRGKTGTRFSCVRYGNVAASRGSVIPLFRVQAKDGTLTITHPDMTRFLLTLETGVRFVLSSLEMMHGGEVFVPRLGACQIVDLARAIAPNAKLHYTGIRPGEKIHELLVAPEEARNCVDLGDRYCLMPQHSWWSDSNWPDAEPMSDGWQYSSDRAPALTAEQLKEMVAD